MRPNWRGSFFRSRPPLVPRVSCLDDLHVKGMDQTVLVQGGTGEHILAQAIPRILVVYLPTPSAADSTVQVNRPPEIGSSSALPPGDGSFPQNIPTTSSSTVDSPSLVRLLNSSREIRSRAMYVRMAGQRFACDQRRRSARTSPQAPTHPWRAWLLFATLCKCAGSSSPRQKVPAMRRSRATAAIAAAVASGLSGPFSRYGAHAWRGTAKGPLLDVTLWRATEGALLVAGGQGRRHGNTERNCRCNSSGGP